MSGDEIGGALPASVPTCAGTTAASDAMPEQQPGTAAKRTDPPDIAGRPPRSLTQGVETRGTTLPQPEMGKVGAGAGGDLASGASALTSLAWRAVAKDRANVDVSLLESGAFASRLVLDPELETIDDDRIRRDPEWAEYVREQQRRGAEVHFVTLRGSFEGRIPLDSSTDEASSEVRLVAEPQVSITLPVTIPAYARRTQDGLSRFLEEAFRKLVAGLPMDLENAKALPGPWEIVVAGRYGIDGVVHRGLDQARANAIREVRTRLRMSPDHRTLTAERRRQLVPSVDVYGGRLLHHDDDLRLRVGAGQELAFYEVEEDRLTMDFAAISDDQATRAYEQLLLLRRPAAGVGLTHDRVDDVAAWADGTRAEINVGYRDSAIAVEASREDIRINSDWIRRDEFRSEAIRDRDVEYERIAWSNNGTLGTSGRTSVGPVTIGGGVKQTFGQYEEMIVERPRSLLGNVASSVQEMRSVPETAEELMARRAGEQFRTLTVERFTADGTIGSGATEALGAVGFGTEVRAGSVLDRNTFRDFKRYVLPDNHVLVDVRHYSMRKLAAELGAEATIQLFERDDVGELFEAYLGGQLGGRLAYTIDEYLGSISLYAEHIRGLEGRQHERMLRAELDLENPGHRRVYGLLEAGKTDAAAALLEKLVATGGAFNHVYEAPRTAGEARVLAQHLPGGASVRASHEEGPGATVKEAHSSVAAANQMIASYVGERIADCGYPDRRAIGLELGKRNSLTLFASEALRETSHEEARYSREGPGGNVQVVTMKRDAAEYRLQRQLLWAGESVAFYLVELEERETGGTEEWGEKTVYVVADFASNEWISRGDLNEFLGFVRATGGNVTHEQIQEPNLLAALIGRRFGSGDIRVRTWIPWEGIQQLGRASDDNLYLAAAINAAMWDGEPGGELPAWATSADAREVFRQYLAAEDPAGLDETDEDDELARRYRQLAGRDVWRDSSPNQKRAFRAAASVMAMRDAFHALEQKDGAASSPAGAVWKDFGESWGREYSTLGILRWTNLLQRDPEAARTRAGDDDLFFIDIAEINSEAHVTVARERATPIDDERMDWARRRAHQGYRIVSL